MFGREDVITNTNTIVFMFINPLNAELNPICHLLALLEAHHIFHVSGLRVNHEFVRCRVLWVFISPTPIFHKTLNSCIAVSPFEGLLKKVAFRDW